MSEDFVLRENSAGVKVQWRIERYLSGPEELDYRLHSPLFSLSDAQWFLEMWPNGYTENVGWICLFLCKRFPTSKKHAVQYTLGIRAKDGSMFKSMDAKHETEWWEIRFGFHQFVLASELRQSDNVLSADGTLTVLATVRLAKPTVPDEAQIVDIPRDATFWVMRSQELSSEWKVEGFTSLPKEEGFCLQSPVFSLAGAEWCLRLYPNGDDSDDLGFVSLLLSRERSSSIKQKVAFTLGIRKKDGTPYRLSHHEAEFPTNTAWGCGKFLKPSEFLDSECGLVDQGFVTFFCTVRVNLSPSATTTLAERRTPTSSHPSHEEKASQTTSSASDSLSLPTCVTVHDNFRNLFVNGSFGDVTIQVQDQKIPVHRAILAARSSVFSAMFEHDTEERRTGIVNVEDIDAESFRAFLSFLYSGDMEVVSANNAIPLYKAADKYNLQDLRNECLRYLQKRLCLGSFCEVTRLAFVHSEQVLLDSATEFFLENAKEIVVTSEWQTMVTEHPVLTNELVIKVLTKKP